jgi:putative DNA primase/helicase
MTFEKSEEERVEHSPHAENDEPQDGEILESAGNSERNVVTSLRLVTNDYGCDEGSEDVVAADTAVLNSLASVVDALENLPMWKGVLGWNEFTQRLAFRRDPPPSVGGREGGELNDLYLSRIRLWFEREKGAVLSREVLCEAARIVARDNAFHPVRDYLASLTWDGTRRLNSWLEEYCAVHANSTDHRRLIESVGTKWLVACVARAMTPGCKVDTMLILEGKQGIGKSRALAALAGTDFFCDGLIDFRTKDACQTIQGVWIYELSELDAILRSETSSSKAFLTRAVDKFRVPYGRSPESIPRSVVFCGTINHGGYLKDRTGNRRFWIVRCEDTIDVEAVRRVRDQLWAEATALYDQGFEWHLTPDEEALMDREQEERIEEDPCEERLAEWLAKQGTAPVSMDALLENALGMRGASKNPAITRRASSVLEGRGYRRMRLSLNGRRCWRYVPSVVLPSQCPTDAQ